jgi:hypothetical protein
VRPWPALAAAGFAAAGVLLLAVRDPHRAGAYGVCPLKALTGLSCPLCGGLRAVHDLTRGDLAAAAGDNLAVLVLLAGAALWWVLWLRRGGGLRPGGLPAVPWWLVRAGGVALLLFTVLRNLPFGGAPAP